MLSGRFEGSSKIARNLSATSRFLLAMPCLDRRETVVTPNLITTHAGAEYRIFPIGSVE